MFETLNFKYVFNKLNIFTPVVYPSYVKWQSSSDVCTPSPIDDDHGFYITKATVCKSNDVAEGSKHKRDASSQITSIGLAHQPTISSGRMKATALYCIWTTTTTIIRTAGR